MSILFESCQKPVLRRECAHTLYTATSEAGNAQVGKINRPQKIPAEEGTARIAPVDLSTLPVLGDYR